MKFLIFPCLVCISSAILNPINPLFSTMKLKFGDLETDAKNLLESMKDEIFSAILQFRSKASSLLSRDHYVDNNDYNADRSFFETMDIQNEMALQLFLHLLNSNNEWTYVGTRDGVTVERKTLAAGEFVSKADSERSGKHACVRSIGIIDSLPEDVFKLFQDNSRVAEYNEHCNVMRDILHLKKTMPNSWSKITWASTPKYGPFRPRDFCSVVNYIRRKDGSFIVLNRPAYHSECPQSSEYVRATILLAGNLIEPCGNGQTKISQIAHINPGGGADTPAVAWIINQLCAIGPPKFFKGLEHCSKCPAILPKMRNAREYSVDSISTKEAISPFTPKCVPRTISFNLPRKRILQPHDIFANPHSPRSAKLAGSTYSVCTRTPELEV